VTSPLLTHRGEALRLLQADISNPEELQEINRAASEVASNWVQPLSGGQEKNNGLIYGLVQSGKTGVLTVTGARAADEGYGAVIILTSDNTALYKQTLERITRAFPGMGIMSKEHLKDRAAFLDRIKRPTCALVLTKNAAILRRVIQHLRVGNIPGMSCLIIDDEADQASLNTRASREDGSQSTINALLDELRSYFHKNTYLQVTATPQALFLQPSNHQYRPDFTILSQPGADYVGGRDFFAENSPLVEEFPIQDLAQLTPGGQPSAAPVPPTSLRNALDLFMVGATFKRHLDPNQNCAFLCHVSTRKADHQFIERILRAYYLDLSEKLRTSHGPTVARLQRAYVALSTTHEAMAAQPFDALLDCMKFYINSSTVRIVNSESDSDVTVDAPYCLFVGGNKLGRGVTIKNLIVSYYGRNPARPQADTVLQHARMYGYRRADLGLLRLFLPRQLLNTFKAINRLEAELRNLIADAPSERFRGILIEGGLLPTRNNVLVPGALRGYVAGANYNPALVLRDESVIERTQELDKLLSQYESRKPYRVPLKEVVTFIRLVSVDPTEAESIWDTEAIVQSIVECARMLSQAEVGLYVDRDRGPRKPRRETAGIIEGDEPDKLARDYLSLYLFRTPAHGGYQPSWWPQVRFPSGRYAFAFAI
jgi:hypothetical protein